MQSLIFTLTVIIYSVLSLPVHAVDMEYGRQLHEKNCTRCHTPEVYTREKRMVNNLAELEGRIRQCELANGLTWFDEDIDAVVTYLNATYYKFEAE
jgi:mono/diheme cytochrome c family protein